MATKEIKATVEIDLLADATALVVASTGTIYLKSKLLPRNASFGVELLFTSGGAIDVLVDVEQGNTRDDDEAAAATVFAIPENSSGTSVGRILQVTDANVHLVNFSPIVSGFIRLKLTGSGSNAADTAISRAKLVYVKGQ